MAIFVLNYKKPIKTWYNSILKKKTSSQPNLLANYIKKE